MAGVWKGEKRERDERRGVKDAQEMGSVGGADGQGKEAQRERVCRGARKRVRSARERRGERDRCYK